jgi:hypothetical protein
MHIIKKRNSLWLAFLFIAMSALFPIASIAQGADWTISTIAGTKDVVGFSTSMAVDSNNKVHIGYIDSEGTDNALRYATNVSGDWLVTTIDSGDVGWDTSIAVDSSDHVHISYYTATNHDLRYATNASGDWVTSTIDSGHLMGIDEIHIAVDSNNKIHICYHGFLDSIGDTLEYITNASGSWVASTIDSGDAGLYSSIAIGSNNKVYISYLYGTDGALKFATNASGRWVKYTVDRKKGVGWQTSIAVDSHNKVHISYTDSIDIALKYATNASGHWVRSVIDSTNGVVGPTSIAIGSGNKVHISYYEEGNQYLKYATNASGHWITSAIDDLGDLGPDTALSTSIAVDSDNKVHIIYYDSANHDLKYAVNQPLELLSPNGGETIPAGSTYSITWSAPSEAVNFRLMYSMNNGKTWLEMHSAPYVTGSSCAWTVPSPTSSRNHCLAKIIGFDVNRKRIGGDMSDATFTIRL